MEVDTKLAAKDDFELFSINFISYKTFGDWYIKFIKSKGWNEVGLFGDDVSFYTPIVNYLATELPKHGIKIISDLDLKIIVWWLIGTLEERK